MTPSHEVHRHRLKHSLMIFHLRTANVFPVLSFIGFAESSCALATRRTVFSLQSDANGIYKATGREYCDAPVYEHVERGQDLKITREPHKNPKTGAIKHGWLLGQGGRPLYGAPTESLAVPASGWKKFGGEEPIPTVQVHLNMDEVLFKSADDRKVEGDQALEKEDWQGAIRHFTDGIDTMKRANDCLSDGFKSRASLLLSRRGGAHMRMQDRKLHFVMQQLQELGVNLKDLEESFSRSAGPGGQNVNKVETAVRLRHTPTGLEVKAQTHRTQLENRVSARRRLAELYKKTVLRVETKADRSLLACFEESQRLHRPQTQAQMVLSTTRATRRRGESTSPQSTILTIFRVAKRRRQHPALYNSLPDRDREVPVMWSSLLTSCHVQALAREALRELGFKDEVVLQKILEPVGSGRILDPAAPLVLRCIDRWTADVLSHFSQVSADCAEEMPMPVHMPSDRYLDGLDEETRAAVIRKYVPQEQFGGTAVISTPAECVDLMKKWEEVFTGPEFQCRRKALWDRRDLSFPARMRETRTMVAESLSKVLEPMGFAPGKPGLARCIKQMQVYWSTDKACADKTLDCLPAQSDFPKLLDTFLKLSRTLDGDEDDDNEFVWSPEIDELELKGSHLLSLFDGLDSRTLLSLSLGYCIEDMLSCGRGPLGRTTEVIVSAPNFGHAKSLLLAACQAAGAPTFCPEEVDATAVRVVADSLKSHIGRDVCGHRASVSEELGCLMLTLRDFRRPFDEQFSSELAGLIEESLSSVSSLPTLGLDSSKPAVSAAARREAYASLGLAAGAAGTVVTGGSALVAVGFAAAAASLGAHAAMGQTDPTSPAVGCAFGRGTSRDLRVSSAAAMLRELLKTGVDLSLVDELTDEERVLGGHLAALRVREAQVVASEDDTPPTLMAPLGLLVNNDNPLLTSMILAAMALITDSMAGAGEINGYVLRSVRVRGCRGCALQFRRAHSCPLM
eukprot:s756_g21.t4